MYILFDIGGTKMRVVGSDNCREFIDDPIVIDTPADFEEGIVALKQSIKTISKGEKIEAIGGGIAGP